MACSKCIKMGASIHTKIALGKRLRSCPVVKCLGVKIDPEAYRAEYLRLLRESPRIYYPTHLYEDTLIALGKETFPRNYYHYLGNKIRQTELFRLLHIPHPKTKIYYGTNKKRKILRDFDYPFIAKIPVGSSQGKGVFLIQEEEHLDSYLTKTSVAYIQEYLSLEKDLRVVLVGGKIILAYWRIAQEGEFRHNVYQGASISFQGIPERVLEFAIDVVQKCGFDEVGLDICLHEGAIYVLEANMIFGLKGFHVAQMDIHDILAKLAVENVI